MMPALNIQCAPTPSLWSVPSVVIPPTPGPSITGSDADVGFTGSDAGGEISGSD